MTPRKAVDGRKAKYVSNDKAKAEGWPLASLPASVETARAYAIALGRKRPDLIPDLIGVAMLAMLDAERTYDPGLGASWPTHFKRRVWGAVKDALVHEYRQGACGMGENTPINTATTTPDVTKLLVWDGVGYQPLGAGLVCDPTDHADNAIDAEALISLANAEDREALRLVFREGLSYAEAAERMGVVKSMVARLVNRGLDTIRERAKPCQ